MTKDKFLKTKEKRDNEVQKEHWLESKIQLYGIHLVKSICYLNDKRQAPFPHFLGLRFISCDLKVFSSQCNTVNYILLYCV